LRQGLSVADAKLAIMTTQYYTASSIDGFIADPDNSLSWLFQFSEPSGRLAALGPDDVDLLVCGSRGYGPARRVLLGGVSSRLIRRARLPVAVVPRATTAYAE
jgi:hypothetical protein